MLTVVIAEKNCAASQQKIQLANQSADAIEWRLDYLEDLNITEIKELKTQFSIPMVFTLRKISQGGLYAGSEEQRLASITQLAALAPEYIDLEYDVPVEFALTLKSKYPKIQLIRSYHDFTNTPNNLAQLFANLQHEIFAIYKLVTFAQSTLDCLRMLNFVRTASATTQLTGFCMGELGVPSRILGAIVGNAIHYACLDDQEQVAPGQLSINTLLATYHLKSLNAATKIYALLGNPVAHSAGHIIHNHAFHHFGKNAVYIKLKLNSAELEEFFELIKSLPFSGFSVTIPHKQNVIPYLDHVDTDAAEMSSVNTIVIDNKKLIGYNTDAKGALDAIAKQTIIAGKKIVIIGAGGTARAIGYEALKRGAKVTYLNRTAEKAQELARELKCVGYGFAEMPSIKSAGYDILINTTPVGMHGNSDTSPVPTEFIIPRCIVMDAIYNPIETPLLKIAKTLHCTLIYGYEMFINQAVLQYALWFAEEKHLDDIRKVYHKHYQEIYLCS